MRTSIYKHKDKKKSMQPLTFEKHRDKYWHRYTNFRFAAGYHTAPIVAAEIPRAALALPLAFIRQGEGVILVAVLSPTPGENLLIAPDGRWLGGYVPSRLRSYPFSLIKESEGKEAILCVDEASGLILSEQTGGISIYNDDGTLSEPLQKVRHALAQFEQNRVVTQQAVRTLFRADVLTEWNFKVTVKGQETSASGLFRVDEVLLGKLPDRQFLLLRHTGALKIAYAQLLSMGNILKLSHLAGMQKQPTPASPAPPVSLGEDDMFRFEK